MSVESVPDERGDGMPVIERRIHRFRCKPRRDPHYGEAYVCDDCGQRWVSTINPGGPYFWTRHA